MRTCGEFWGFSSSIFFEMKRLFEVRKLDITSLLCCLLLVEYFVGINFSIYLFYEVLKSVFQIFCTALIRCINSSVVAILRWKKDGDWYICP